MSFQAGPYRWYGSLTPNGAMTDLGVVDGPPQISVTPHSEEIRGDNMGDTIQDLIIRGQTITIDITFQEWNPANFFLIYPHVTGATNLNNVFAFPTANMGCRMSAYARHLRATRMYSCPADGGAQWEFYKTVPHPNFPISFTMGSRLRNVPMRFLLLPYELSTDNYVHYVVS